MTSSNSSTNNRSNKKKIQKGVARNENLYEHRRKTGWSTHKKKTPSPDTKDTTGKKCAKCNSAGKRGVWRATNAKLVEQQWWRSGRGKKRWRWLNTPSTRTGPKKIGRVTLEATKWFILLTRMWKRFRSTTKAKSEDRCIGARPCSNYIHTLNIIRVVSWWNCVVGWVSEGGGRGCRV